MAVDKKVIKQYLKCKEKEYPSYEDFIVWMDKKKKADIFTDDLREYKGYINIYSKQWLNNRISQGGRNSGNFLTLLRSLEEIQEKAQEVDPVRIINDIPKTKKGQRARTKIKRPNSK